jgi:Leucine-rich repeat (LRR) protein
MKIKGKPFPIKEGSFEFTPEDYSNLVQIDDFMEAFKQALHKINTKENETKEYEEVWKSHQ